MSIPVSGGSVSNVTQQASEQTEDAQYKKKAKADHTKDVENKKAADAKQKTDEKIHKTFAKSLQSFGPGTDKQFDLATKSYLGKKPNLSPPKQESDSIDTQDNQEDNQETENTDNSKSTAKTSSKSGTSSGSVTTSKGKNVKNQQFAKVAKSKNQTVASDKDKEVSSAKKTKATKHAEKTAKSKVDTMTTQKEMDDFIVGMHKFTSKIQSVIDDAINKFYGKSENTDSQYGSKATSDKDSTSSKTHEGHTSKESNTAEYQTKTKSKMSKDSPLADYGAEETMTGDGEKKSGKSGSTQASDNIPDHIKTARQHAMRIKANLTNIVNSASLQTLIASYLDTRGAYSIKIMLAMYKLKKGKAKTTTANLSDAQNTRSLASDRQIKATEKQQEAAEKAEKDQKTMGIIGVVVAAVAVIIAVVATVCTFGAATPALLGCILAVVGLIGAVAGMSISVADLFKTNTEGDQKMGKFSACIYKSLRNDGISKEDAQKDTMYISLGIQAGLIILSLGAGAAGVAKGAATVVEAAEEGASEYITGMKKLLEAVSNAVVEHGATINRITARIGGLLEGITGLTSMGYGIDKAIVEKEATMLQAKVVEVQGMFEKIEQNEQIYKELMLRNMKRLSETVNNVSSVLESEYQAIKLLNARSKVA